MMQLDPGYLALINAAREWQVRDVALDDTQAHAERRMQWMAAQAMLDDYYAAWVQAREREG